MAVPDICRYQFTAIHPQTDLPTMDSATQFLLGASISGATLGSRLGGRALLIGGLVATLPDLDSLVSMGNAIDDMTYHRGVSHSVFVLTLVAPVVAFAVARTVRDGREIFPRLLLTVWLCLVTHSILDSLTTYGTQIFWPLPVRAPAAWPAVFIIDPLYTILLLTGVLCLWLMRRYRRRGLAINRALLAVSGIYLGLGLSANMIVRANAEAQPELQGMRVFVQPAPFNILFWQVLAVDDSHYATGLTSPLPSCPIAHLARHERLAVAPHGFQPDESVRRLEWFTDGFYTYQDRGDSIAIADLRIGYHPDFVFSFEIARTAAGGFAAVEPVQVSPETPRSDSVGSIIAGAAQSLDSCPA